MSKTSGSNTAENYIKPNNVVSNTHYAKMHDLINSALPDIKQRIIALLVNQYSHRGSLVVVPETMMVDENNFGEVKYYLNVMISIAKDLPMQIIIPSPFSIIAVTGMLPKPIRGTDFIVDGVVSFKAPPKDPTFKDKAYSYRQYRSIEEVPDDELFYTEFAHVTQSMFIPSEVPSHINSRVLTPSLKGTKSDEEATLQKDDTYQLSLLYEYEMLTKIPTESVLAYCRIPTRLFRPLQRDGVLKDVPRDSKIPLVFTLPNTTNVICTNIPL